MYIGSNNRPCRNGPTCYYLKRNRCFFYHPPSHYQNLSNSSDRHFPKSNPLFKHSNSELKTLLKTISVLSLSEKIQKKKEEEENNFFIDNGTKVAMIPIKSTIKDKDKSWFFQRARHYNHYPKSKHETCSICLNDFSEEKLVSQLYCNHGFHKDCIEKWIQNNIVCPLCKRDFTKHQSYEKMAGYKKYEPKLMPSFSLIQSIYNNFNLPPIDFQDDLDDQFNFYEHQDYVNESYDDDDFYDDGLVEYQNYDDSW